MAVQEAKQREKLAFFMLRHVTCQVATPACASATLGRMRRPAIALLVILLGLGLFASGLAWVLDTPRPPAGASRAERTYLALCATCHGVDGHGSWRSTVFLIRPGDLADPTRMRQQSDQYLMDIIKHGGAPLGRPGMPAFGSMLSDDDIRDLVAYLRTLSTPNVRTSVR